MKTSNQLVRTVGTLSITLLLGLNVLADPPSRGKEGHGGNAVVGGKVKLLDLLESVPDFLIPEKLTYIQDLKEKLKVFESKVETTPVQPSDLIWVLTNDDLRKLSDQGVIEYQFKQGEKLEQLAIQKDGTVLIRKDLFENMEPKDQEAFLIHELLIATALSKNLDLYGQLGTRPIRELVGVLFHPDAAQLPQRYFKNIWQKLKAKVIMEITQLPNGRIRIVEPRLIKNGVEYSFDSRGSNEPYYYNLNFFNSKPFVHQGRGYTQNFSNGFKDEKIGPYSINGLCRLLETEINAKGFVLKEMKGELIKSQFLEKIYFAKITTPKLDVWCRTCNLPSFNSEIQDQDRDEYFTRRDPLWSQPFNNWTEALNRLLELGTKKYPSIDEIEVKTGFTTSVIPAVTEFQCW